MSNAERKREAARQHNAELDQPKVEPLFAWFEALSGNQRVMPVRETRRRNRHPAVLLMAAALMYQPSLTTYAGHDEIIRSERNRRKW